MAEVHVGRVEDFDDERRRKVRLDGAEIVVLRWRDEFYAFENICAHMGGPVGEGVIIGKVKAVLGEDQSYLGEYFDDEEPHLVCPWHGWEYKLRTGAFVVDERRRLRRFDVDVRDGGVYVRT